ncbi:MAG: hypothetical protein U0105_03170 [Candidatus Obscuribacterales bacterium]
MANDALTLFEQKAVDDLAVEMFDTTDHQQFAQRLEAVAQLCNCSVAQLMIYVRASAQVFHSAPRNQQGEFQCLAFDLSEAKAGLRHARTQSTLSRRLAKV